MALEITVGTGFHREEDRFHDATIDSIEETDHAQYGAGLKWILILDDADEGSDYPETWAFSSQTISPGSKVHGWLTGIYGRAPATGQSIDLGKLFGVRVGVKFGAHRTDSEKTGRCRFPGSR